MERQLWPVLYHELRAVGERVRQKYVQRQPWVIAAVLLWAAVHDRPVSWACDPAHWDTPLRPDPLPTAGTLSRRAKRAGFAVFLNAVSERLRGAGLPGLVLAIDGKPLVVGGCSHDPDARYGRGAGQFARGYKLHAIWGRRAMPEAWEVTPLSEHEVNAGERLAGQLTGGGYVVADGNYDAGRLFDRLAARGYQLVAAQRKANPGGGHRRPSAARRRGIELWQSEFGQAVYRCRTGIERAFAHATGFAGGLGPLPAWVRRLGRVQRWVWAKLVINAARIRLRTAQPQRLTARLQ